MPLAPLPERTVSIVPSSREQSFAAPGRALRERRKSVATAAAAEQQQSQQSQQRKGATLQTPSLAVGNRSFAPPGSPQTAAGGDFDQSDDGDVKATTGRIEWLARLPRTRDNTVQPVTLHDGVKCPYSSEEAQTYAKTPYEAGRMLYVYEGGLRHVRQAEAPRIPPGAAHNPLYTQRQSTGEPFSKLTYPMGDYYEGDWRAGKRHGFGTFRISKGYRFQGEWKDDRPCGKGEEEFANHEMVKCSQYINFRPTREATIFYSPQEFGAKYRYQGEIKHGRRHGNGKIFYDNGDVFRGTFREGKRHGRGVLTTSDGRQYEELWEDDDLRGPPQEIVHGSSRSPPRRPSSDRKEDEEVLAAACLAPADLTKWRVREGVTELSLEHFHRLKAGFEDLDTECTGVLSTADLRRLWGNKDQHMLRKLDRNNDGCVDLYEILLEWYPDVKESQLLRFVEIEPDLHHIHRMRGVLGDVREPHGDGFCALTAHDGGVLRQSTLEAAGFQIGGETFSLTLWNRAAALRDPPGFSEALVAWYPNTPRSVLNRYEMLRLPYSELDAVYHSFRHLEADEGSNVLHIDAFREARRQHRMDLRRKAHQSSRGRSSSPHRRTMIGSPPNVMAMSTSIGMNSIKLLRRMRVYFFKGEPCWPLGKHMRITVPLLEQVEQTLAASVIHSLRPKRGGYVHLLEILRFCFPNVPCMRNVELLSPVEALMGASPEEYSPPSCTCDICDFSRHRGIADPIFGTDGTPT
eukprot:TRINITY_DN7018_c0_g1_i1.p1 TRINITY_DN7018_c0_g1~~TRINITY_DN7018_c0_g1_i1.p1  ORF type:complete len:819 (+),score=175.09 TRINITY_DN7018_c0_g1_i1:228-2459(+)